MGGSGSTRWNYVRTRNTTGQALTLDLRKFKDMFARIPVAFTTAWSNYGDGKATIRGAIWNRTEMTLDYAVKRGDGSWTDIHSVVPLSWTPCNYGGERPWFRCPACDRRVLLLYIAPGSSLFRCRHCHDLAYVSQQCDPNDRLLLRIRNIQRRLGGDPAHLLPWRAPPIPKGMRWRTYQRLVEEMYRCEQERSVYLRISFNRLVKRSAYLLSRYER